MSQAHIWETLKLRQKKWGDQVIVYNFLSGHTHLLNSSAASILEILEKEPATSLRVAQKLSEKLGLQNADEVVEQVFLVGG